MALAAALIHYVPAAAQSPAAEPVQKWVRPAFDSDIVSALYCGAEPVDGGSASRASRIRLQQMLPGFVSDPPSLSAFDDVPGMAAAPVGNTGPNWMTVNFGDDNPLLDPRRSGDPGGVGFVQIYSQMQLFDTGGSSLCLALRGWTPAGVENGGVQQGPTVFAPGVSAFQDLGAGTALQGFVDQHLRNAYQHGPLRCGVAWDCPIDLWEDNSDRSLFFYVQGLGRVDYGPDRKGRPTSWELVPGIHWQLSDSMWLSLGASRTRMLTCGWSF
jgi:hypothetical protein